MPGCTGVSSREIIEPTVRGLEAEGRAYTGFLYAGLMIDRDGTPRVLEYNCRGGDPETQPVMMRLRSDLVELCEAAIDARLDRGRGPLGRSRRSRCGDGLAGIPGLVPPGRSGDWPRARAKQVPRQRDNWISSMRPSRHRASTSSRGSRCSTRGPGSAGGRVLTDGGRVFCVCALDEDVRGAAEPAPTGGSRAFAGPMPTTAATSAIVRWSARGRKSLRMKMPVRVGLFATCLVDLFRPNVGFAAVKLLEEAGCERRRAPASDVLRAARLQQRGFRDEPGYRPAGDRSLRRLRLRGGAVRILRRGPQAALSAPLSHRSSLARARRSARPALLRADAVPGRQAPP